MTNQLDVRPNAAHLSEPTELANYLDGYLDYALDICEIAQEADELTAKLSSHALFLSATFTEKMPLIVIDEKDFGENLGKRLRQSLYDDGLVAENSPIMLSHNPKDFIYFAAMRMVQDFVALIQDSSEKKESADVFDLRRTAFVADWVNRFLGKDKYAR